MARPIPATSQRRWDFVVRGLACGLTLLLGSSPTLAQSFERGGGSVATSLAGARAAAVTDATALWHNPAGLALERQTKLSLVAGLSMLAERSRYESTAQPPIRSVASPRFAPQIAARLPLFGGALTLAAGYRLTGQRGLRFAPTADEQIQPQDCDVVLPRLRYLGRRMESHEHAATLAVAGRRGALAFGAAVELGYATLEGERALFSGGAVDPLDSACRVVSAGWSLDGLSVGGRAGVSVTPAWWFSVGLLIELPRWSSLSGPLALTPPTRPPSGATAATTRDGASELTLLEPLELALGLAMNLSRDLKLHAELGLRLGAADAQLRPSGAALVLDEGTASERALALPELPLYPERRLRWRANLGLRWSLLDDLITLRGGWAYLGADPDGAPTSAIVSAPQHRLGLGVTVARGGWRASLALAHDFSTATELTRPPLALLPNSDVSAAVGGDISTSRTRVLAEVQLDL